ncbi:hypothetical protein [Flavobacterium microcysteis]
METPLTHQETLQFTEVYLSDIATLKTIFFQAFPKNQDITPAFGVPFLVAKKENETVAFASLTLNAKDEIDFNIYNNPIMTEEEKLIFVSFVTNYIKKQDTGNFHNPEQLKNMINKILQWLN